VQSLNDATAPLMAAAAANAANVNTNQASGEGQGGTVFLGAVSTGIYLFCFATTFWHIFCN
jgi:hypothetical protein